MKLLCRLLGHRPWMADVFPFLRRYYKSEFHSVVEPGLYTLRLSDQCSRCGTRFTVGFTHVPADYFKLKSDWIHRRQEEKKRTAS